MYAYLNNAVHAYCDAVQHLCGDVVRCTHIPEGGTSSREDTPARWPPLESGCRIEYPQYSFSKRNIPFGWYCMLVGLESWRPGFNSQWRLTVISCGIGYKDSGWHGGESDSLTLGISLKIFLWNILKREEEGCCDAVQHRCKSRMAMLWDAAPSQKVALAVGKVLPLGGHH